MDEEGDKNNNSGGELVEGGGVERAMARTRYKELYLLFYFIRLKKNPSLEIMRVELKAAPYSAILNQHTYQPASHVS